jgi:spermidine synthase
MKSDFEYYITTLTNTIISSGQDHFSSWPVNELIFSLFYLFHGDWYNNCIPLQNRGTNLIAIEQTNYDQNDIVMPTHRTWAIFIVSLLSLFVEMLLIRWIGTEIRIFAYLQNTILVVCFLGLGLGYFSCRQPIRLRLSLVPLLILTLFMAVPVIRLSLGYTSELLSVLRDFTIWASTFANSPWTTVAYVGLGLLLTYCVLILIVDIFVPIGRLLGRMIDDHPDSILAYSVNVAGSLIGTWLFVMVSFFYLPPFCWFLVFVIGMVIVFAWTHRNWKLNLSLLIVILILSWFAGRVPSALNIIWSPYQKLVVSTTKRDAFGNGDLLLTVNNTGYQLITDLSASHISSNPELYDPKQQGLSQYDIPLLLHPDPKTYLIVGAGTGNDAAGGLRNGLDDITAVEIDPAIISIGRTYHPEKPYSSPNVHVIIDDARSFFATTSIKFDVISFGLLDSHTMTSLTNTRLDHYVYTRESILRAKSLLADGGVMVLTFAPQELYIADRIEIVLKDVFGEAPISFLIPPTPYGWGGLMFITGNLSVARQQIAQNIRLSAYISSLQQAHPVSLPGSTRITTDDWPYLYLESPKIPILFLLLAGLIFLILIRSLRRWNSKEIFSNWKRSHWHFFFLGAAFLLLEVQNISKASVVLGNTWIVNAVIVSGVLSMALLANWLAYKFPKLPVRYAYIALIVICLILYFVDLAQFAFLPYSTKALVVGSLTTLPMLFSGIIFIRSFASTEGKNEALGANLIGALVGALLQTVTFVIGIKALLLVVAGFYILSIVTMRTQNKIVEPLS